MGSVKRNDVVVFNFPNGDTVVAEKPDRDYYEICRSEGGREMVNKLYTIITRPVDKKENYIKRCVGIPGDKLQLVDGILYVNDKKGEIFPHAQMHYIVEVKNGSGFSEDFLDENKIQLLENAGNLYRLNIPNDKIDLVKGLNNIVSLKLEQLPFGSTMDWAFPQDPQHYRWNRDNYGPFVVPKKGVNVKLTPENISFYKRIIVNYEGNTLEIKNDQFYINGTLTDNYTFKMDYYWMMGDNRHDSADSRYWGFVPEDHIVGKASFVWFSFENSIFNLRWSRLLRSVNSLSH